MFGWWLFCSYFFSCLVSQRSLKAVNFLSPYHFVNFSLRLISPRNNCKYFCLGPRLWYVHASAGSQLFLAFCFITFCFLEMFAQAHAWGSLARFLQMPCMRTFVQIWILFWKLFYYILFDLIPVGVHWSSLNQLATSFVDFLGPRTCGHRFQNAQRILFFALCYCVRMASTQVSLLADKPHIFLFFVNDG